MRKRINLDRNIFNKVLLYGFTKSIVDNFCTDVPKQYIFVKSHDAMTHHQFASFRPIFFMGTATDILGRGIRTIAKFRLLNKNRPHCNVFGQSMQKNLPKIGNSWLKLPPKFSASPGHNFGSTDTYMEFWCGIFCFCRKFSRPNSIRGVCTM